MEQQRFIRKNQALFDAQRRQEKKRTRRTVFYVLLFVAVSLIFIAVCFAVFLNVETIEVNGNEKYSYEEIVSMIPVEIGDNIYSFKAGETEESIMRALPYVGAVNISRDLPKTVIVDITEEKAYFAADLAGETYLLSSGLKVLERTNGVSASETGLTELKVSNVRRCVVGETMEFVDGRTADAINELYAVFEKNYINDDITSLDVRSRFDIYFDYQGRFEVYMGDMQNCDIKIRFLVGIIAELYPTDRGTIDVSNHTEASVLLK